MSEIKVVPERCEDCTWHECAKFLGGCGCKCHRPPEREPQRSEVKPNEAQSQKSAAIEQARPQPPTPEPNPDWWMCDECGAETADTNYHYWATKHEKYTRHQPLIPPAAAEPAPERTPPHVQEIAARIHERYNALNCRGYSTKEWIAALKATEQEIARAVAVPEPAAQPKFKANLPEEVEFAKEIATDLGLGCKASNPYHKGCLYCGAVNKIAEKLRARQAEPSPTPSRPKFDYEIQIQEDGTLNVRQIEPAKVDAHRFLEIVNNVLAEASALGTKEEHEI